MKLPPWAHTFNFPPRGRAHPPRVQYTVSQVMVSHLSTQPATNYHLLFRHFVTSSCVSRKRSILLFLAGDTNGRYQVPQQTSVRLHVFLSPPRALSTFVLPTPPPPSIPLLSLRNVDIVDSMFDMVSALNGSIGYVTASSKLVFLFFLNLQIDDNASFNVKEDRSGRALTLILSN